MIRPQFVGLVQWPLETQFLDKKMQLQWMLIVLMEVKVRRAKARANRALGKEKEKEIEKGKAKMPNSLERANRQMESGPQIKTLGTRAGTKVNSLERVMQRVAKLLPKEKAKLRVSIVVLQGILLETAR